MPKISIVLVVKNALPLMKGTLDSLRRQTFKDFEVIVADGASTDGTLDVLRKAQSDLPLRIVSEPDRSLADGLAKALARANGEIVGMLCADERYYPDTLEQVVKWFDAGPTAAVWSGKVDFIDVHDKIVGVHTAAPFNLQAHLACELVPAILPSFFNRGLIGGDFKYDASLPTCPDYEFWARLGMRFPTAAFNHYDIGIAQAYRTRDSMSFRAESFTQFCRDKLTHLTNLLTRGCTWTDIDAVRRRSSAGIHMWAAEQLSGIEPGHPDILAHCAAAARFDKSYERIARLVASIPNVRYHAASGTIRRNLPGPRAAAVTRYECDTPLPHWTGAAILGQNPLALRTASAPWGFSLEMPLPKSTRENLNGGQYWARIDLEVVEGSIGVGMFTSDQNLLGEEIFGPADGRAVALIPLTPEIDPATPVMVRSGGHPDSILRVHRAELLHDPDSNAVAAIHIGE